MSMTSTSNRKVYGISKRTAPQTIRQVNGVGGKGQQYQRAIEGSKASMRSTRSVASTRGQQVRGVGKQVGVLGVGNKVGAHGVSEQTTGPRHRRVSRKSTASTSNPKVQGVSAGPRHRQAAEGSLCQQTNGSANNQPVDGFGGRGRRPQRAIAGPGVGKQSQGPRHQ